MRELTEDEDVDLSYMPDGDLKEALINLIKRGEVMNSGFKRDGKIVDQRAVGTLGRGDV